MQILNYSTTLVVDTISLPAPGEIVTSFSPEPQVEGGPVPLTLASYLVLAHACNSGVSRNGSI